MHVCNNKLICAVLIAGEKDADRPKPVKKARQLQPGEHADDNEDYAPKPAPKSKAATGNNAEDVEALLDLVCN